MAAGPCTAGNRSIRTEPNWQDLVLFYEYFHGGQRFGVGASHQNGGTVCGQTAQQSGERVAASRRGRRKELEECAS